MFCSTGYFTINLRGFVSKKVWNIQIFDAWQVLTRISFRIRYEIVVVFGPSLRFLDSLPVTPEDSNGNFIHNKFIIIYWIFKMLLLFFRRNLQLNPQIQRKSSKVQNWSKIPKQYSLNQLNKSKRKYMIIKIVITSSCTWMNVRGLNKTKGLNVNVKIWCETMTIVL